MIDNGGGFNWLGSDNGSDNNLIDSGGVFNWSGNGSDYNSSERGDSSFSWLGSGNGCDNNSSDSDDSRLLRVTTVF